LANLTYYADDREVPESTLTELFFEAIDRHGETAALQRLRTETVVDDISYRRVLDTVKRISAALVDSGLERGDRVAILSENRPEWALTDYACLCAGVIPVPIYPSLTASQVAYILEDSGARMVFVSSPKQMNKALEATAELRERMELVIFDPPAELPDGVTSWEAFLERGRERAAGTSDADFRAHALTCAPHDTATVLYTSGTTGAPKGVMLTHNNVASNVRAADMVLKVEATDNTVSFLPLSHILQRMVDYLFFWRGCTIGYARSLDTLTDDFKILRPTIVVSVPRIYEKIYNRVMDAHGLKKAILGWAVDVADRVATERLAGREPGGLLALQYALADRLVFRKVKAAVGGRLRFFVSGGGPLAPDLNRFFYSIGMTILEGYGLTETSPVTHVNTVEDFRIGYVGKPVPATEVRIGEDGEILIRGPQVMKGYFNRPEATAEVIDDEGWFATGDIGEIDADGFLKITDRKKDLIVTAGGKNVAPQPIENRVTTHELVEQAVLVGDRRRYCSLLVVPAFPALEAWARGRGISWSSYEELTKDPRVVAHVEKELFGMLQDLASFEMPKKIALLAEEFTVENGFLTPTLKVKRRVVQERLDAVIDALYEEEAANTTDY
jgi:long-chain acyl-CoA synthetase